MVAVLKSLSLFVTAGVCEIGGAGLSRAAPLRVSLGSLTWFSRAPRDVRLYRGALSQQEIVALAR